MRIQNGDQGHLATLPLVKSKTPIGDVLNKMNQFRQGAVVVEGKHRTYTVVTADEISSALGSEHGKKGHSTHVGELCTDREAVQHADFGVMGRMMHDLWEVRGGQLDYRIVAVGHNAATVLGPSADYWEKLKAK